jgi:aromatic ring-cleaving dioxygenase
MTALDKYRTEKELAERIREKTGQRSPRMLRKWRARRIGPPWVKVGKLILYPDDDFEEWLRSLVQRPVRSRRRGSVPEAA